MMSGGGQISNGAGRHEGTLHKNDSLHSHKLFQVTEKNSENQSMMIGQS